MRQDDQDQAAPRAMPDDAVAIVGAGPGGLAAARWLLAHGMEPVLFEAADAPGGQWNPAAPGSGTWPGMCTNTSRVMTAFSDLDHPDGTATCPSREEMQAYLQHYAGLHGIAARVRCRTRVAGLEPATGGGWLLRTEGPDGPQAWRFARVIVASGRHAVPEIPAIPGLDGFTGRHGAIHAAAYDGPERYRGATIVTAGCSISALEIASDLALNRVRVVASYRRQRYVLPKLNAGLPTDHVLFNRAAALAAERLPPAALEGGLKTAVLRAGGDPAPYGAPAADPSIFAAGIAQAQHFLPCVAEGRIAVKPWIAAVEGSEIRFTDGSTVTADGLLFGTGYRLDLPWLAPRVRDRLAPDGWHLDLCDFTFHPDLPVLAFLGLYEMAGPYLPVLELQARWIAYAFAGLRPAPTEAGLRDGVARARAARSGPPVLPMHDMALLFARRAGVEPELDRWPALERALLFGPLSPASFRLQGPDSLAEAPDRARAAAAAFGGEAENRFTPEEEGLRGLLHGNPAAEARGSAA
ncbi:flavin-containing monooxygenase [Marinibaculum pumilum]|uniref:Trimethylamine monooxygenase n=1 Tax=Marinibaculum pumilum TaxID=1766165 RepID=A0ABV7KTS8_9PROT